MALDFKTKDNLKDQRALSSEAIAVTPADGADLATIQAALFIGTGGNIKVDMSGSGTVTFSNVADGTFLPILVDRVYATDTTASNILALY
jgi:hypothetical protein